MRGRVRARDERRLSEGKPKLQLGDRATLDLDASVMEMIKATVNKPNPEACEGDVLPLSKISENQRFKCA